MLGLLSEVQIDRVVTHRRMLMSVGIAVIALAISLPAGWEIGIFSGFMLFSLGIYGITFRRWRTEPGVWMLAVLLTLLLGPCWVYFEVLQMRQILVQPAAGALNWDRLRLTVDCTVALLIIAHTVRLAITVAMENWKRTTGE